MKEKNKKWKMRVLSLGLAMACLCGGALAAGDEDDPLISLSYLTKTVIPEILEQVDERAEEYQTNLLEEFNEAIDEYKGEMRQEQAENSKSATYAAVTLSQGQKLSLSLGSEILFRAGMVKISAAKSASLVDMSGGDALGEGGTPEVNHLYVAAVSECVITAKSENVTVLVRGTYQVS